MVASRPYSDIKKLFECNPQISLVAREMDIKLYIEGRIRLNNQEPFGRPEVTKYIVDSLHEKMPWYLPHGQVIDV